MDVTTLSDGQCLRVPLEMLVDAPWGNVRRGERNPQKFEELKTSIAARGVIQGITVRPNDEDNTLETLAGYGRRDASRAAGLEDIPVIIKRVDDKEGIAIGLAENLQREDLSIRDEIIMSQQFVSLADGDYEEAARALGWDERKVRARIRLNDCSRAVLDALGEGKIKIGHAEVLCQFTEKLQDGTLEKILDEGWTIDYLKERANKATRLLRHARFDLAECQNCPHNSSVQAGLFDNHIGGGKCSNLPCYRKKTDEWLAGRKAELEQEEGKVLLALEKPPEDRRTVGPEIVGEEAFTSECLNCVSRVRILKDGINKDCGEVIENQCINLTCFREKVEAFKVKSATDKAGAASKDGKAKKTSAAKTTAKKKGASVTLPTGVKDQAEAFVRKVVGEKLMEQPSFNLAVTLLGVARLTGFSVEIDGKKVSTSPTDQVVALAQWDTERLRAEIRKAVSFGVIEAGAQHGFDGKATVLAAAKLVESREADVTQSWKPTKAWLETYQKGGIEALCRHKKVAFDRAYDEAKGTAAFATLMKRKKAEIIKEVLSFEHDWSGAVPPEVGALVA